MFNFIATQIGKFIAGGGAKRLGIWTASVAVPVLNDKLGLHLSDQAIGLVLASGVAMVGQSMINTLHERATDVRRVKAVDDAMAILGGAKEVPPPAVAAP